MLNLLVHNPDGQLFCGEVDSVTLPGTAGRFTVLDNHAPIISSLESGKVICNGANGVQEFVCASGFVQVENNRVIVCIE